jgi:hypothetical protein
MTDPSGYAKCSAVPAVSDAPRPLVPGRRHAGDGASRHPSEGINSQIFDELNATGAIVAGAGTFEPAGGWGGDHHDGVPIFIYRAATSLGSPSAAGRS